MTRRPVYYNERDPHAAAWLEALIAAGHLPAGDVDRRDVRDVRPEEVRHCTQQHYFAGIGGWPLALSLAGWPADRPVWTGSCPCQPFSAAGKGKGEEDERHLWPAWMALIRVARPGCLFGEQVGSAAGYRWLDGVRTDLESEGYAFGAADLPAACVGAPHIRQRLFWVASLPSDAGQQPSRNAFAGRSAEASTAAPARRRQKVRQSGRHSGSGRASNTDGRQPRNGRLQRGGQHGQQPQDGGADEGSDSGFWSRFDLVHYRDGKTRRVEPGAFPLAHGVPARLVKLRGYGNAIVPQTAAAFVTAFMETTS